MLGLLVVEIDLVVGVVLVGVGCQLVAVGDVVGRRQCWWEQCLLVVVEH